jgi:methyl-accepting chemotaxis protein
MLARWVVRPVQALSAAAAQAGGGDLTTRVKPMGALEMRQLADRFNAMIAQLEELVTGLRDMSSHATDSATKLSSAAEELASATTEQTSAATETSASMEELARTSMSIAETLERLSVQAQETKENLQQAQADMQASGVRTVALAGRVNDINEILTLINEIADQTNLLALNAAIEAARAGDAGRGFAVVADEVRRLAERSKTSAGKIAKIIDSARTESNATVMAIEQSSKQMDRGLRLLDDVVEASSHVQLITQQQRTATDQVVEAMEQIAVGSRQVATTAHEISQAAAGHAGLATELEKLSGNGSKKV